MKWLSRGVDVLINLPHTGDGAEIHDAVVVGSGYGGAVSALRLSEQGLRVVVLERGNEYVTGEFPNDLGEAFGHVRLERESGRSVNGYESGLYDLRIGDGIGALVGNGLGGTSLINASVVMEPDPRVFAKQRDGVNAWPQPLATDGADVSHSLREGYKRARSMLDPQQFTASHAFRTDVADGQGARSHFGKPEKRHRLEELCEAIAGTVGPEVQVSLTPVELTVDLGQAAGASLPMTSACAGCGECVSGCNLNAKKTLTYSYLPRAYEAGARMFTGVTVLSVERVAAHWVVHYVRTEARKLQRDGVSVPVHELHARKVVLSAGTFGSTEILHRSRQRHGLSLSDRLGKHLSTNGDSLSFAYMGEKRVNGIGIGSAESPGKGYAVGPTITASIRIDDSGDVSKSMLIQDGAVPGAIAGLFHELMSTSATFAQLNRWAFLDMPSTGSGGENATDWARLAPRGLMNTQTLLGIGHDPSAGSLGFDPEKDRLRMAYPCDQITSVAQLQDRYLKQVEVQGGIYLPNPVLHPLPESVSDLLSGPRMKESTFTVHPLGGCCMADSPEHGVVDHLGRVFDVRPGGEIALHGGLLVLDGSIVPTSLGANPLFTIAALAERAMAAPQPASASSKQQETRPAVDLPVVAANDCPTFNPHLKEVNVYFTEAMRARDGNFQWLESRSNAHLLLHLPIDDLQLFGTDGRHLIAIPNQLGARYRDREELEPLLSIDSPRPADEPLARAKPLARLRVQSGWVSILPVPKVSWHGAVSLWLRTGLTWLIERGWDESWRSVLLPDPPAARHKEPFHPARKTGFFGKIKGFFSRIKSLLKLCGHASESRTMEYRLQLMDVQPPGNCVRTYTLHGIKQVGYPARWRALLWYLLGVQRPLRRANVWTAFGELHTRITDEDGTEVGRGILSLDMLDMTRMHAPQLSSQRDTPNALVALGGYPLWMIRLLAKTRLWDFRLPDYPTHVPPELTCGESVPVPDVDTPTPWPQFPALRIYEGGRRKMKNVFADPSVPLTVRSSEDDCRPVVVKLTRYRQPSIEQKKNSAGLTQFRTLLMLNGFAQSTLSFVPQELTRKPGGANDEPGLAEFFYEQGFDVWLFDYRSSAILDASKLPGTMDDIARYDIPAAVQKILATLAQESSVRADTIQIYAFAHCVGAASMAMSLLGGFLKHDGTGADQLAGVTFSQMQAFLVGSKTAQMRLQVGGILRDTLGIDFMRLSAAERTPSTMESMLDRLFASLPVDSGEDCPYEHDRIRPRPGICTCKRMSGTISRLLKHDRIKEETHDKLAVYFGRANTSLLVHGGRCVDNERLVNVDGQNVYVNDANIRDHLHLPIAILHGRHNALFDVESAHRTSQQFKRIHPAMEAARLHELIIAEDYAHFDCTIGHGEDKKMQEQILEPLRKFYQRAWDWDPTHGVDYKQKLLAELVKRPFGRAPLAGPLIGWTRTVKRAGKHYRLVRLWIEVDDTQVDRADWIVTHCRTGKECENDAHMPHPAQLWPVIRVPLQDIAGRPDVAELAPLVPGAHEPYIAIGLADLEFDLTADWDVPVTVRMFSMHHTLFDPPAPPPDAPDQGAVTSASASGQSRSPLTSAEKDEANKRHEIPFSLPGYHIALSKSMQAFLEQDLNTGVQFSQPPPQRPNAGQILPFDQLTSSDGVTMWSTLRGDIEDQRVAALGADPGTLSRKLRRLALPDVYGPALAKLDPSTIQGPAAGEGLCFIAGCCRHPGLACEDTRSDASLARVSDHLLQAPLRPAFMLMLGDQIYADATAGVMDRPSAIEKIALGHRRAFATSGFLGLTSSLPTYMVIDDHEIADNWSRDQVIAGTSSGDLFYTARASFTAYQWAHGPRNIAAPGFNAEFDEGGCPFFILDTRTQRWRFKTPQICDPAQLAKLDRWLQTHGHADPRPKFVVSGSVFAPGLLQGETGIAGLSDALSDTWQMAQHQRVQVLDMIENHGVKNVVFLSGDYHCGTTAELEFSCGLRAYSIVTPPLYAQLPAANAKPRDMIARECVTLTAGVTVQIKSQPALPGDGFCQIRAIPQKNRQWRLEVEAYLLDASSKEPRYCASPRIFVLS